MPVVLMAENDEPGERAVANVIVIDKPSFVPKVSVLVYQSKRFLQTRNPDWAVLPPHTEFGPPRDLVAEHKNRCSYSKNAV
jgi:hypothetical protein